MNAASADQTLTLKWSNFYIARGFHPLPSRPDKKQPMVRYSHLWESPPDPGLFLKHQTTNIQVLTGRHWRLLVIDLDGPEAVETFGSWGRVPTTWTTHSGGNGRHLWFRLPAGLQQELPKAFLWKGEGSHTAVERLCDRSLIMAPPSIHPKTGQRYRFASKAESPARLPLPALCPGWVLRLKPLDMRPEPVPFVPPSRPTGPRTIPIGRYDRREVLDAIPDKVGIARHWGLRIAGNLQPNGFVPCHAIGREDRNPSAGIFAATGTYVEPGAALRLSLFDLGVTLGQYRDFAEAVADLGRQFGAREVA